MTTLRHSQVIILMKEKSSKKRRKSAARKQTGKANMPSTARGLTGQAGLLPVVKYLGRIGFEKIVRQDVPCKRGDNANYQLSGVVMLTLVGMIGGAASIAKLCAVRSM